MFNIGDSLCCRDHARNIGKDNVKSKNSDQDREPPFSYSQPAVPIFVLGAGVGDTLLDSNLGK